MTDRRRITVRLLFEQTLEEQNSFQQFTKYELLSITFVG